MSWLIFARGTETERSTLRGLDGRKITNMPTVEEVTEAHPHSVPIFILEQQNDVLRVQSKICDV